MSMSYCTAFNPTEVSVKATDTTYKTIVINFGLDSIIVSREQAEEIYKGIEQSLWDESEWSGNLAKQVEDLEYKNNCLEERMAEIEECERVGNYD